MAQKRVIRTPTAPAAIGPYSQGVKTGDLIFTAGQIGLDPNTGELAPGGIQAETRQVLSNIQNILEAAGSSMKNVIKTTVFLRDLNEFAAMNTVYAEFFPESPPARSTVQVAGLPKSVAVEIEVVAVLG
jgi:2-iminobutanoate/2-iminopropanoate deaminase